MPVWFVIWSCVAAVGLLASFSRALVFYTLMISFGFAAPVWLVAANLWLVLLLVAPWVYCRHIGQPRKGAIASAALVAVGLVAYFGIQAVQLASFATQTVVVAPTAPIRSIEIVDLNGELFEGGTCGDLCQQILSGNDLDWLRMTSGDPVQSTLIRRTETCPNPCLQVAPDSGRPADIRIAVETVGNGYVTRKKLSGLAFLLSRQRLTVTDLRSDAVLRDQSRNLWMQAAFPVPLHVNVEFDGNGLHGGGVTFPWQRKSDPALNVGVVMHDLSLTMGPKPDATPLVASLMDLPGGDLGGPRGLQITGWLRSFGDGHPPTQAERILLRRAPTLPGLQAYGLEGLMARCPDPFMPDFRSLYAQVASPDDAIATRAAVVILRQVTKDPLGSHDSEAALYLDALKSPKQRRLLLNIAGRYGFDPTPLLQDAAQDPSYDYRLIHVAYAACLSDPKWTATLAPFLHALMVPLVSNRTGYNEDVLRQGTAALLNLGRTDLAQDLRDRVDWDKVMQATGLRTHPVPTMQGLQDRVMGNLTAPATCDPPLL